MSEQTQKGLVSYLQFDADNRLGEDGPTHQFNHFPGLGSQVDLVSELGEIFLEVHDIVWIGFGCQDGRFMLH